MVAFRRPHDPSREPISLRVRRRDPFDRDLFRQGVEQGPPKRGDQGEAIDRQWSDRPGRVPYPGQSRVAQVDRKRRRERQVQAYALLDSGQIREAGNLRVRAPKRYIGVPDLTEGARDRPCHARKEPHLLYFSKAARRESVLDGTIELL